MNESPIRITLIHIYSCCNDNPQLEANNFLIDEFKRGIVFTNSISCPSITLYLMISYIYVVQLVVIQLVVCFFSEMMGFSFNSLKSYTPFNLNTYFFICLYIK